MRDYNAATAQHAPQEMPAPRTYSILNDCEGWVRKILKSNSCLFSCVRNTEVPFLLQHLSITNTMYSNVEVSVKQLEYSSRVHDTILLHIQLISSPRLDI